MRIIARRQQNRLFMVLVSILLIVLIIPRAVAKQDSQKHNVIIFVADGLRPNSVNPTSTPILYEVRQRGVNFVNSHALFPTFTTANSSAIATGHYLGDTGDFSNTINVGFPVSSAKNSIVPFLENDTVLGEVNKHFGGNFLDEESLLGMVRRSGFSTAAVGKLGPVLIQDITQRSGQPTIVIDDATGSKNGLPLSSEVTKLLLQNGLAVKAPSRGDNGKAGNSKTMGTTVANTNQQQYFADVTTKVILPLFKQRQKPFVLVYWSRDPDGTQHNQGDSLNSLTPGINGPTSQAAVMNADRNLAQLRAALRHLGLEANTNLLVTADHGFSTISKQSNTSYAASLTYPDVSKGLLPPGFLATDLAHRLALPLFDPDKQNAPLNPALGQFSKNALIGKDPNNSEIVVAANGGSDLIYLLRTPNSDLKARARQVVNLLLKQDYVSGLFVDDALGSIPGTLPLSAIRLHGKARTPIPSIIVNFRSFDTGCAHPQACGVAVGDTSLQQGQGMHGSFSRADTYNNMAAIGPDFKKSFVDQFPVSNADVAVTLAYVLGIQMPNHGKLVGRVLSESLVGAGRQKVTSTSGTLKSQPATNGLRTVLKYQDVGQTRYFDAAGFPGRTNGLEP